MVLPPLRVWVLLLWDGSNCPVLRVLLWLLLRLLPPQRLLRLGQRLKEVPLQLECLRPLKQLLGQVRLALPGTTALHPFSACTTGTLRHHKNGKTTLYDSLLLQLLAFVVLLWIRLGTQQAITYPVARTLVLYLLQGLQLQLMQAVKALLVLL